MAEKNSTLRGLIQGAVYDLLPKTNVYNVWVDSKTTLAAKLAEVITSLNGKVTQEQLATAIEEALADFDGGVSPEQVAEAIESAILENGIIKRELLPEGYPYTDFAEIFPEQTISFPEETDYQAPLLQPVGLVAGGTYEVSWNGTVYLCVAESADMEGAQIVIMGDLGAMSGEPTGSHPFTIVEFPPEFAGVTGGIYGAIVPLDGSESAVISIRGGANIPIDPKFLPEGYPYVIEGGTTVLEETTLTKTKNSGFTLPVALNTKATYKVTWNGTEYIVSPVSFASDAYSGIYWGDGSFFSGEPAEEPFTIAVISGMGQIVMANDGSAAPTVKIVTEKSYVPMSEKYLSTGGLRLVNGTNRGSMRSADSKEEDDTYKVGNYSFVVGGDAQADGNHSVALGHGANATGEESVAIGRGCVAKFADQHVFGKYNDYEDANNFKNTFVVGVGGGDSSRVNGFTVDYVGSGWFRKGLKVGGESSSDSASRSVLTTGDRTPNPRAITFTGAVQGTYDGSEALTINIPTGGSSADSVPAYVQTEAELVARLVNEHQSGDSIVFPFLSDAHCGYYRDTENAAAALAGRLLNQIGKRTPYDFIVHGGDMASGAWDTTKALSFEQIEDYTEIMSDGNKGVPSLWCCGNHDDAPYQDTDNRVTQKELFGLVGRKNRISGAICPDGCNYGYLDLENRKLRVIFLDTDDKRSWGTVSVGSGETAPDYLNSHNLSGAQLQWLANTALDFSGKDNAAEWSIVVVSHVALNISGTITDAVSGTNYAHSTANAATILNAYKSGRSGSITHNSVTVAYDFSSVENRAAVICAVHAHNHMFSDETVGSILSIGCPNVMNGRERESADGNTYTKTAGTADGTSFCIITIDRENSVIYADCVGVGYDREFTFSTSAVAYTNQIPISTDTDGSVFNGVGYQEGYRLGSSGTPSAVSVAAYLTGFIPCKVGDTVYMKNVTFQYGVTDNLTSSNQRLSFYDASKTHIVQTNATGLGGVAAGVKGDDNIWTQFTVKSTMNEADCSGVAYFRINAAYIGEDSIITVNEEIL